MRRLFAFGLVALLLFALGIAIGRRSVSPGTDAAPPTVLLDAPSVTSTPCAPLPAAAVPAASVPR